MYRAAEDLRRCVRSVLANTDHGFRLFLIDDASRDPDVDAVLDEVRGRAEVTVWRNNRNCGFAASVNRVLRHGSGDVVILNSDVIVTPGWLTKLVATAASRPRVATVTPLTNFGSICTVPPSSIRHDLSSLDGIRRMAAEVEARSLVLRPEILVGVGFCLYIRREALEAVGFFEEKAYGRGYGEEVEFCWRARQLGFMHLMEDSTFVYHRGGGSFGASREQLIVRHGEILAKRHPDFEPKRREYEIYNVGRAVFRNLEHAAMPRDTPCILYLLHRAPSGIGGIERHTGALVEVLRKRHRVALCYPRDGRLWLDVYSGSAAPESRSHAFPIAASPDGSRWEEAYRGALTQVLEVVGPSVVHIQHLEGHALSGLELLLERGLRTFVSLRDFFLLCPNFHLQYKGDGYCGLPTSASVCDACAAASFGWRSGVLATRRERVDQALRRVDGVIAPHASVLALFGRVFDVSRWRAHVHEHGTLCPPGPTAELDPTYFDGPLRVAFVGTAQTVKGYGLFLRLAERLACPDIEFLHLGGRAGEPVHARVAALGPYAPDGVVRALHRVRVHLIVMLARSPETHSHVLSEAITAGIPVVATNMGALGERVTRHGIGWVVPVDDLNAVEALVRRLARDRRPLRECSSTARAVALQTIETDAAGLLEIYSMSESSTSRPSSEAPIPAGQHAAALAAFAADNARLARELQNMREECERLRRELGQAPRMSLGVEDVQATRTYQLALALRRRWRRLPAPARQLADRLVQRLF